MWATALWGLPGPGDVTLMVRQMYNVGVLSLIIIVLSAFSIGAVISLQFYRITSYNVCYTKLLRVSGFSSTDQRPFFLVTMTSGAMYSVSSPLGVYA